MLDWKALYREHTNEELRTPRFIYEKVGRKRLKTGEDGNKPKEAAPIEDEAGMDAPIEDGSDMDASDMDALQDGADMNVVAVESSPSITATELEDDVPIPHPSSSSKGPGQQVAAPACRSAVFGKGWQGYEEGPLSNELLCKVHVAADVTSLQAVWMPSSNVS